MTGRSDCRVRRLVDGLYRDAASVGAMLRAYDLVTVVIVMPALVVSLRPSWRRTALAQLIWLSALAYGVYNYAIFVFGSAFNELFLVHGQLVLPATSIHLGYVLDLALLVPACVLSSVLLWRRPPWGYLLGTVTLLFGAVYQVCYMTALVRQTAAGLPGASWFDLAKPVILGVFAVAAAFMLIGCCAPIWISEDKVSGTARDRRQHGSSFAPRRADLRSTRRRQRISASGPPDRVRCGSDQRGQAT